MSESMQVTPQARASAPQSKLSSVGTGDNPGPNEEIASFDETLATYSEPLSDVKDQKLENLLVEVDELLPQELFENGNTLPLDENTAMWQALLTLQPMEKTLTNSTAPQMQTLSLLEGYRQPALKPELNSSLDNQDYFSSMLLQKKDVAASLPNGFIANNPNIQLAAVHLNPESNDALLLNMNEQLMPVQGLNPTASQGLAAVGFGTAVQAANTQTQMAPLNLGQNAWESNLGSKLQMLIGQNVQTAEIRLDPPELGSLDIKIKIVNDVATVHITSPHAHVRESLETAVPRLREMFEQSGVVLGDVNVRQESFTQQDQATQDDRGMSVGTNDADFAEEEVMPVQKIVSNGLLDIYA